MEESATPQPQDSASIQSPEASVAEKTTTTPIKDSANSDKMENAIPRPRNSPNVKGRHVTSADEGFYKHFLTPGLAELEAAVSKQTAFLDEINKKMEDERNAKKKEEQSKHIPGPLKGEGQKLEDITKKLNDLIEYENYDEEVDNQSKLVKARLRNLDDHENVALVAHSLAAYVSTLEPSHAGNVTNKIMSDLNLWLSRMFRFNDSSAYFHNEEKDGLVKLCRLVMHQKYPKYATDGFMALYTRPPVIYLSAAARPGLGQYLCAQLGLPGSCLCIVPCNTVFGSQHKIDIATFERLVAEDLESQKTPLLLVAYAGTPAIGHVDNLQRLGQICKKNNIWLHVEGNHLATLAMYSIPTSVQPAKTGDSITLNLAAWLGLPGVPYISLYKAENQELVEAVGLTSSCVNSKLTSLPVWVTLQDMGHDGVVARVKASMDLAKAMSDRLKKIPTIMQLNLPSSNKSDNKTTEINSLSSLFSRAISALLIFEIANPVIVFKFGKNNEDPGKTVAPYASPKDEVEMEVEEIDREYYDALNIWLAETLKRETTRVHLQTLQLDGSGVAIRFAPMETAQIAGTTKEDVDYFLESLEEQVEILSATVNQRQHYRDVVLAQDNLRLIEMSHWAGLGVVQYVPSEWLDHVNALPPHGVRDVNALNAEMVHQLKNNDTAFSLGHTDDGLNCVRFGLITDDTDIEELIGLVYTTGKQVEESSKFLEKMAENVKKGIEAANKDLEKENEEKLIQEGVLRQVPLVGSLYNWFSPPPKEAAVKGRMFNLSSGTVKSTEETYKYHMQIQEAAEEAKQEHKPFKASLKSPKSKDAPELPVNGIMHSPKASNTKCISISLGKKPVNKEQDTPVEAEDLNVSVKSAAEIVENLSKNVEGSPQTENTQAASLSTNEQSAPEDSEADLK